MSDRFEAREKNVDEYRRALRKSWMKKASTTRRLAILQDPHYYSIVDDYNRLCSQLQSITEVNECALRPDICGHGKCIDIKEGYECECDLGYARKFGGRCEDVDECQLDYCQGGICRNLPGSFACDCPPGFVVSGEGRYCTGNRRFKFHFSTIIKIIATSITQCEI